MIAYRHHILRALRLILPMSALALMATVFLLSRSIDPEVAVLDAGLDISTLTREPRVGGARIATVTRDDSNLIIHAQTIRSGDALDRDTPVMLFLDAPRGTIAFPNARDVQFEAEDGKIDQQDDLIIMTGAVRLETSDGYVMDTPELRSTLSEVDVRGVGGVSGHGPAGELSADSLRLWRDPNAGDGYVLAFTGNVRLLYHPQD